MIKKSDESGTVEMPAVSLGGFKAETHPEIVVQSFARKVEGLMNEAVENDTVHKRRLKYGGENWTPGKVRA